MALLRENQPTGLRKSLWGEERPGRKIVVLSRFCYEKAQPKIFEIYKNEYRISNKECRVMKFSFDIRYSLFDILRFKKTPKCNVLQM
jgi:hypothetical protein